MPDRLTICNNALAEIAADPISSLDEKSLGARECLRIFPQVFSEMLTWTEWDFVNRRVTLALLTNDRSSEWLYRYGKPADMAEANMVIPGGQEAAGSLPSVGPYVFPRNDALGRFPFLIAGGSIYSNVKAAVLEYQTNEVEVGAVDALTSRALELELAARLAMPIKKSRELKTDMIRQAEVARQRAVAESENRNPRSSIDYISPVEYAREGLSDYGL